jgi:FtsZ-binding cell division protein ZapB
MTSEERIKILENKINDLIADKEILYNDCLGMQVQIETLKAQNEQLKAKLNNK